MRTIFACLFVLLLAAAANARNDSYQLTLKIISTPNAPVYVAVYKSAQDFLKVDQATVSERFTKSDEGLYTIGPLPQGDYALSVFLDSNGNGELDTSFWGLPEEPYGFSNNAKGLLGPPSYEECRFSITGDMTMEIELQ